MNIRAVLCFIIIMPAIISCTRVKKETYPDGTTSSELTYRRGTLHGKAVWYYENGIRKFECNYNNGELEGASIRWYANGVMQSRDHYEANLKNGKSEFWDEHSNLAREENYFGDTLHGPYRQYFPDGIVMVEGLYTKGLYDSTWTYRNEYGVVVGQGEFKLGNGVVRLKDVTNGSRKETWYRSNLKHGDETWWDESGNMVQIIHYEYGEIMAKKGGQ